MRSPVIALRPALYRPVPGLLAVLLWRGSSALAISASPGEEGFGVNGDGVVDGGRLPLLAGNWMWSLPPLASDQPIPEPATLWLLAMGAAACACRKGRQLGM